MDNVDIKETGCGPIVQFIIEATKRAYLTQDIPRLERVPSQDHEKIRTREALMVPCVPSNHPQDQ